MSAHNNRRPVSSGAAINKKANQTGRSLPRCPDCAAPLVAGGHLQHETTCPAGLGLDQVNADDRKWFEDRPDAPHRVRALHWAEVACFLRPAGYLGDDQAAAGKVIVWPADGLLLKTPFDIVLTPRGGAR